MRTAFLLLALAFTATAGAGSAPPVPTPVAGVGADQSVADSAHRWRVRSAAGVEFGGYVMKVSRAAQGHTRARPFVGAPSAYGRHYVALQPVRRGIASLVEGRPVDGGPGVAFRIDFARLSVDNTRIDHTVINVPRAPGASCSARLFRVDWPAVRIVAPVTVAPAQTCDADAVSYAFASRDGGRTWRVAPGR